MCVQSIMIQAKSNTRNVRSVSNRSYLPLLMVHVAPNESKQTISMCIKTILLRHINSIYVFPTT